MCMMTPGEFEARIQEIAKSYDLEESHYEADKLMCSVLKDLGYGKGVTAFQYMPKWYA